MLTLLHPVMNASKLVSVENAALKNAVESKLLL
jgi:hypothetical protein